MSMVFVRIFAFLFVFGALAVARAQMPPLPGNPGLEAGTDTDPEQAEQALETVRRGIIDLRSDDPGIRAGAVMLLGKYEMAPARLAVVEALRDPAARVRRAAVIAALDWAYDLPPAAAVELLLRLGDEDVEVRRDVSARLPLLVTQAQVQRIMQGRGMGLPDETVPVVRAALFDEDPFVRANLIHNFSMLNLELDDAEWIALAGDEAPAVRRRALPLAARRLEFAQLRPVVEQLMQAEDPADRLLVAETLRYRPEPETLEVLERLTGDPDDEVAGEALITLARRAPTEARMATLVDWLEAGRLGAQQGKNALRVLLTRAPLTEETIARLTAIDRSVWQAEIAQVHLASLERKALGRAVLGYLDSPQSEVRRMATAYLSGLPELLSREVAEGLLQSRHSDVRLRAVALLPQMPREVSQSLAPQFLFDPDGDVRASALRYLADMRANGWERMVRGALSDKDPAPQREAIRVLSRLPLEERQAIIEPFLSGDPDSEIASQLRRLLPNR